MQTALPSENWNYFWICQHTLGNTNQKTKENTSDMKFDIFESLSDIILKKDNKLNHLDIYRINMYNDICGFFFFSFWICKHVYELFMNEHILLLS